MKYIVTNFAYGTGPYLRTTELAIAFNDEYEARGFPRLPIIVPWVYGDRQKIVMMQEFGAHAHKYPDEILLDATLGSILKSVFYTGRAAYEKTLAIWISQGELASQQARTHLQGTITVENLFGVTANINGSDIVLEINRSPRLTYSVAPRYSTTFGYVADILEQSLAVGTSTIAVDPDLLRKGIALADKIEGEQDMHLMAYPGTFSWQGTSKVSRYADEISVPPITSLPKPSVDVLDPGLYVTITGIEGLERLYKEAEALGLKLYCNDAASVPGSTFALPDSIGNGAISFQFARAGWGSIWLSMFLAKPLVVPTYDPTDDPEIYFNNIAVRELGIGHVYQNESLTEILAMGEQIRAKQISLTQEIEKKFGSLDGNAYAANIFVDKFIKDTI